MLFAQSDASKMTMGVSIGDARKPARLGEICTEEDATPVPDVDERQGASLLLTCFALPSLTWPHVSLTFVRV